MILVAVREELDWQAFCVPYLTLLQAGAAVLPYQRGRHTAAAMVGCIRYIFIRAAHRFDLLLSTAFNKLTTATIL
jgi:hypothetical protein